MSCVTQLIYKWVLFQESFLSRRQNNLVTLLTLYVLILREVIKTSQYRKTLPLVHFIGCRGVKFFLPKDFLKFCKKINSFVIM